MASDAGTVWHPHDTDDVFVRRLLDAARHRTGMQAAWLSQLVDGEQTFSFVQGGGRAAPVEGSSAPVEGSYCQRVLDGRLPPVVPDTAADPRTAALPITVARGIGSYIGVPVRLGDDEVFGTLSCVADGPSPALDERDVGFLEALAALIGSELQHQAEQQREAERRRTVMVHALEAGLEIVFQPIVDLRTAQIVGAEALARFAESRIDPEAWFRDAADVELGQHLQLAAVAEALRHIDQLPDDVYLAVNASPAVIVHPRLHELLASVPAGRIVVEITEHAAVDDYEELAEAVGRLRARGVRLAIDDAGAGFSSLRHVLRLRPDIIKLDMSITRNVDSDPVRRALAEALVTFAGVIGATIVAEGVETRAELDALLALGAGSAQGFFLRRPGVLPLPDRVPGPTPRLLGLPAEPPADSGTRTPRRGDPLAAVVPPMLDAALELTDLETAYLALFDEATEHLVVTHVCSNATSSIPEGIRMPWAESLSKLCLDLGIRWTAEAPTDLGARRTFGVQTYASVPVETPDGRFLGAFAVASTKRRYLDAATYDQLLSFARSIGERLADAPPPSSSPGPGSLFRERRAVGPVG